MYRKTVTEQLKLEMPFGVMLDAENRWVKLSAIMPWGKIEEKYSANFKGTSGQEAKPSRLAFGALYIQRRLKLTDEETVAQIWENPSMQFFCGFDMYSIQKPFDSSLMVHFRKRLSEEIMKEIAETAFVEEAKKAIEAETKKQNNDDDDNNDSNGNHGTSNNHDSNNQNDNKPKGTLLLDATCCPADIHFPTDIGLLNHGRELLESMIDELWKSLSEHLKITLFNATKPRTYRETARNAYMAYVKKRKNTYDEIQFAIRSQLQYVRRNLDTITEMIANGADESILGEELLKKLDTIKEVYRQQKYMYDNKTHTVEDRIVSIAQPHIRPIVRGKAGVPVEFGAKVATAHIGGFTFIIHTGYDNFSEGKYLIKTVEAYKRMFGFYPKTVIGDKAYTTRENRNYCKSKGIRLSCQKMGRKTDSEKEAERKQLYEDTCTRNAVEGDYGVVKRKYGLDLMMTKLYETTLTAISFGFFVKNMERLLRFFVLLFLVAYGNKWFVKNVRFAN
jgi:hypothetical protein